MVDVSPNEHLGGRRVRASAWWYGPDASKVLEELMQGGARRVLAASTRRPRQESRHVRLVEIADRDPRGPHPSSKLHDRPPLVVLRLLRVALLREDLEECRQMHLEAIRDGRA
jgi:hypothetical protein